MSRARPRRCWKSWHSSTRSPALLLQHRQLSKLKSTYLDALPGLVHPEDRPHSRVVQPERRRDRPAELERPQLAEYSRPHRGRPPDPPGIHRGPARLAALLTADYSQIELRILAHYSDDPALCPGLCPRPATFTRPWPRGSSASTRAAVDDSMRRVAKTVNFGVVYGLSAYGLSSRLGISQTEAAASSRRIFRNMPASIGSSPRCSKFAQTKGSCRDDLGPAAADQWDQVDDRPHRATSPSARRSTP